MFYKIKNIKNELSWILFILSHLLFAFYISNNIHSKDAFPYYNWDRYTFSKNVTSVYQVTIVDNKKEIDFLKSPLFYTKSNREYYQIQRLAKKSQFLKLEQFLSKFFTTKDYGFKVYELLITPKEYYLQNKFIKKQLLFEKDKEVIEI